MNINKRKNESLIHTLPKPDKNIFIYCLSDPVTDEVKYVGMTTSGFERIKSHYDDCH